MLPDRADTVIIGGGIAGASLAYRLAERDARDLVLIEREGAHDVHSTGRSAATLHVLIPEPATLLLSAASSRFFHRPPPGFSDVPILAPRGTIIVGRGREHHRHRILGTVVRAQGVPWRTLTPREVADKLPAVDPGGIDGGMHFAEDGVIDIHALVTGYVDGARRSGAVIATDVEARGIHTEDGEVRGVETTAGYVAAKRVAIASGAWAGDAARWAGAERLPLTPCRRHLVVGLTDAPVDPSWPLVVDVDRSVYFRPEPAPGEGSGLLVCPMDAEPMPACDPKTDEQWIATAADRLEQVAPALKLRRIHTAWAGLRTLTPDGAFVIGPDPVVRGLHWQAGVGGYGIQTSPAAAAVGADLLTKGRCKWFDARLVSPARFATSTYALDHRLRGLRALFGPTPALA